MLICLGKCDNKPSAVPENYILFRIRMTRLITLNMSEEPVGQTKGGGRRGQKSMEEYTNGEREL